MGAHVTLYLLSRVLSFTKPKFDNILLSDKPGEMSDSDVYYNIIISLKKPIRY